VSDELTELRRSHERLQLLYHVSTVIHATLDPQEALKLILGETVRLLRASSGSIVLLNPTTGVLDIEAAHNLPAAAAALRLRPGEGVTGWVARHGRPARVDDVRRDPRYVKLVEGVRSELAVPLEVDGLVRGVINVDSDRPAAFSAEDERLLEELARQAARVIHNTWLYEQLRQRARLFESLVAVGQTINSTLDLREALQVITREACLLMSAKLCSVLLLDDSRQWLRLHASHGAGRAYIEKPQLSVAESLLGIVVRRRKPIQIENVQTSSRYQNIAVARAEGLVSLLSVPLVFSGQVIGTLSVYSGEPHQFSNEEVTILTALAELSALAIEKARLYERIVEVEEHLRQNEKLSALGLLAAEVAHEIRNPLTVMKMLYHSLDLRFADGDPRATDTRIIREKMDLLNQIVEQILDFARTTEPRRQPVNVNQLLDDLTLLTRHKLRQHRVELRRELAPGLPTVMGDTAQLEQAFLNLTLNAVEAMPEGGPLVISTRLDGTGTRVVVEFRDAGRGMSEEQRQQLFSSLLRSKKAKGTGLGLAIVKRIAEAHRGQLEIASQPGAGTTITLALPAGGEATG
jgi:signal transduction histidine kinase